MRGLISEILPLHESADPFQSHAPYEASRVVLSKIGKLYFNPIGGCRLSREHFGTRLDFAANARASYFHAHASLRLTGEHAGGCGGFARRLPRPKGADGYHRPGRTDVSLWNTAMQILIREHPNRFGRRPCFISLRARSERNAGIIISVMAAGCRAGRIPLRGPGNEPPSRECGRKRSKSAPRRAIAERRKNHAAFSARPEPPQKCRVSERRRGPTLAHRTPGRVSIMKANGGALAAPS